MHQAYKDELDKLQEMCNIMSQNFDNGISEMQGKYDAAVHEIQSLR